MTRKAREVEIFSLSALDLFASAMGAFVLLTVMMLPSYLKGKEYEDEIGQLELEIAQSAAAAKAAELSVEEVARRVAQVEVSHEVQLLAEKAALRRGKDRQKELANTMAGLKGRITAAKQQLTKNSRPKTKKKNKVTFRFLGLNSDEDSYLILVDGAKRVHEFAPNLPNILKNTISVFGPDKRFAIAFYNNSGGKLYFARWPDKSFKEGGPENRAQALSFMRAQYLQMQGGSATLEAMKRALQDDADSIIFISDGFMLPQFNRNLSWQAVVREITSANISGVEINSVAVGIFNRSPKYWRFLDELRRSNNGDLKAIPP